MRIEVLSIGDELLDGRVTDSNTVRLAHALESIGESLAQRTTVLDDTSAIIREIRAAVSRGAKLCICSGGLGPTADDLTTAAFAQLMGVQLVRDEAAAERITALLVRRGREVSPHQLKQADRPAGAELIPNPVGMAPGFAVHIDGCRFVVLPGVPAEFDAMVEAAVVAPKRGEGEPRLRAALCCFGLPESDADRRLHEIASRFPEVRLGFRIKFPEVHVTLKAHPDDAAAFAGARDLARKALGPFIFADREVAFAQPVVDALSKRGETLAVAESCTGGLVGDMVTDVAGSSGVFVLGVVAYAEKSKAELLRVPREVLADHGVVSEQTVLAMALGVQRLAGATYGLAITGLAGPGGASADQPVGTVWLGVAGPDFTRTHMLRLPHERRGNKIVSAYSALDLLRTELARRDNVLIT